jgi:CBS domain-containing protein
MEALEEYREFLAKVPPFDAVAPDVLLPLVKAIDIAYYRQGEALGSFGGAESSQGALYVIRRGTVALSDPQGELLEQRGEAELFGHAIHFDSAPQPYQAVVSEDALIWRLAPEPLARLATLAPEVMAFLAASPGQRLALADVQPSAARLDELALPTPVVGALQISVQEAARRMSEAGVSCLPLVNEENVLKGILTDRDLRNRVLAEGHDGRLPVADVMTAEPLTARGSDSTEHALQLMLSRGIHHLPVVDEDGQLFRVVSAGDLLRQHAPNPLRLVRDIGRAEEPGVIAELAARARPVIAELAASLRDVSQVGRMASQITDACTRRLIDLAEARLGEPPMRYAWLAFGSQARQEQGLVSDQDNGLLLARAPNQAEAQWFQALAEQVCDGLNACGYTWCLGGVMAKGRWRMSLADWQDTFAGWIREPDPKSVMHCSIFFDHRCVAGDTSLVSSLQGWVREHARDNRIFLRFMAAEGLQHRPPIGVFRQFVQERGGATGERGLDLKKRGVLPLVDLARVFALEVGAEVAHTEARFHAAAEAGLINAQDAEDLVQAMRFILRLRLEHQSRQVARGEAPDNWLSPARLSALHRRYLRSAFDVVRTSQRATAQRFLL